jgi:hypothetical protein
MSEPTEQSETSDMSRRESTEPTYYYVRIGGSPPESAERYTSEEEAWLAGERMAQTQAQAQGLDTECLDRWYDEGEWGCDGTVEPTIHLGGVCPDGDTGAYWPVVYRDRTPEDVAEGEA